MSRRHHRLAVGFAALVVALGVTAVAVAAGANGTSAQGGGWSNAGGTIKHFAFSAQQRSSTTLDATGYVVEIQDDETGIFGDFRLQGHVDCLRVVGNHAVIGLTIEKGSGTAAGHEGEAFYLDMNDNGSAPDQFDNSGYTFTSVVDCNTFDGFPGGTVFRGNINVQQ